jgi:hypothetical protein
MATSNQPKIGAAGTAKRATKAASSSQRHSAKGAKKQPPSPQEAVRAELETIVDNPGLWLDTPTPLFGGRTPGELIGTQDQKLLRDWIGSVKHGMFS